MGVHRRNAAGLALLVQSCVMTLSGCTLLFLPTTMDFLVGTSSTRSALHTARALGYVLGAILVYLAAILCALPEPSPSTCRSVAAGAAVAAIACAWAAIVPPEQVALNSAVVWGASLYFAAIVLTMLILSPRQASSKSQVDIPSGIEGKKPASAATGGAPSKAPAKQKRTIN